MISVDENHTDSTPLKFELELTDGLETWFVEFDLPVPWPVLKLPVWKLTIAVETGFSTQEKRPLWKSR